MKTIRPEHCILGIDPGFGRCGYGVIEGDGREWKYVAHGCIETDSDKNFIERLFELYTELTKILSSYPITCAGVEKLFFCKNAKTAVDVGQARGVILLTLAQAGIVILEYTPLEIKQSLTNYGRADKAQVRKMVEYFLEKKFPHDLDDAIDALGVALTASKHSFFR